MKTFVSEPLSASLALNTLVENSIVDLGDHADARSTAQLVLAAATLAAPQLADMLDLDPIVKALEGAFSEKVKRNDVRQEAERHDNSIRGALRALRMLETVPEITQNHPFQLLWLLLWERVDSWRSMTHSGAATSK